MKNDDWNKKTFFNFMCNTTKYELKVHARFFVKKRKKKNDLLIQFHYR